MINVRAFTVSFFFNTTLYFDKNTESLKRHYTIKCIYKNELAVAENDSHIFSLSFSFWVSFGFDPMIMGKQEFENAKLSSRNSDYN